MTDPSSERRETRREQLRQQTRVEILQAAAHLIAQKGVTSLSMDEVAALSGLSKGSLYNYFSNREELIWLVIDTYHQHFLEQALPLMESAASFRERFTSLVDLTLASLDSETGLAVVCDYFEEQVAKARYEVRSASGDNRNIMLNYVQQFHEQFAPFFASALSSGEVRGSDAMSLSVTFTTTLFHLFEFTRLGLVHGNRDQHREFVLSLFLP